MQPKLIVRTDQNQAELGNEVKRFIEQVISTLLSMDCKLLFKDLIGSPQAAQKDIVRRFQNDLLTNLNTGITVNESVWAVEVKAHLDYRDSYDLSLEKIMDGIKYIIIIELDKNRADQVAKKFLSRISHTIDCPTVYFAFCYPGTEKMNLSECKKYFHYFSNITNKMSSKETPKVFVGITTE